MRIALLGTPTTDRITFVQQFLERWPMYVGFNYFYEFGGESTSKAISDKYRSSVKDFIADMTLSRDVHRISTGSPIEVWLKMLIFNDVGKEGYTDDLLIDCRYLMYECLKAIDIVFYLPAEEGADDKYFDNLIDAAITSYEKREKSIFPLEDCPAFIRLIGPRDVWLDQLSLYIKQDGGCYSADDPSLLDSSLL